jgi:hypothetical protein
MFINFGRLSNFCSAACGLRQTEALKSVKSSPSVTSISIFHKKSEGSAMADCSILENLSDEIKLSICLQLVTEGGDAWEGFYSLTALRLTCKAFAFLPTSIVSRVVKLYPSMDSLHDLQSIALRPGCGPCVRIVEVDSPFIPPCDKYNNCSRWSMHILRKLMTWLLRSKN